MGLGAPPSRVFMFNKICAVIEDRQRKLKATDIRAERCILDSVQLAIRLADQMPAISN